MLLAISKQLILVIQISSLVSVPICVSASSDPNDVPGNQQDEPHEVPGEPLTPQDFKNAEKVSSQASENASVDPLEKAGLFEGDIIIRNGDSKNNQGKNAVADSGQKWSNAIVPYMISSRFNEQERSIIARAIMEFHHQTCITFKPLSKEPDYVMLTTGDGCSSPVGRIGGVQYVTLGEGCIHPGIVMHELMHAVGFWHEQSRWDRDDHVTVNFENIQPGMEENFRKMSWKETQNLSAPYDTSSILHYGPFAFSKNRRQLKTIVPKYPNEKMGQRSNFSEIDIYKINKLYKCNRKQGGNESNSENVSTTASPTTTESGSGDGSKCSDNHKDCQKWANSGECQKNPNWMLVNCKQSCNQCRSSCSNNNKHCDTWAANGECSKNPGYMNEHCAKACKRCK